MSDQGFHAEVRALLRDRLLDAAFELTCSHGWQAVTMGRIAERVGVSRKSVYNEIGTKNDLGVALIARETERFLAGVSAQLQAHPGDPGRGLPAATEFVMRTAADNPLVKAVVLGAPGGNNDLLPLLTTHPEPVLQPALARIQADAAVLYPQLPPDTRVWLIEVFVRLTLSHLTQPVGPVEDAVAQIRTLVAHATTATIETGSDTSEETTKR
ncbi:TetR/AcrR family transcriptional regulator [Saccharopolyspora mangrovi]|uniref:TetR family transcriptional regulator n=1 Tax=Saccharopolyspora mangrovi TaxID=3082379 RepID=A0ABU6A4Z8_9PSEU|nr:TetR family transcriptional regulator [Saccharopolyspora sp. S2-29]MEB3366628.1 TetR family transcriptional regulator [Saccharopolyspora sp. S2-29]